MTPHLSVSLRIYVHCPTCQPDWRLVGRNHAASPLLHQVDLRSDCSNQIAAETGDTQEMRARSKVQHDATALAPAVETEPVSQAGPRSVGRIVDTLALLVRVPAGLSLSELARRLQVPKASLADLLA